MAYPMSIDTQTLKAVLVTKGVGEVVEYKELSAAIGRDVQIHARYNLSSALRSLLSDGLVFGVVHGVGVKRLEDREIVEVGSKSLQKIRRVTRKSVAKLGAVRDFEGLTQDQKILHNASVSALAVISHITKPGTMLQLRARVSEASKTLPLQRTLEALSKS